jgi:glycerophosphoryl diester phosphodiesterase
MLVWAHRGYHKDAVENSVSAFHQAETYDFHGIELDIRITKCDTPILYHDATLERHYHVAKAIKDMTYSEIQDEIQGRGAIETLQDGLMAIQKIMRNNKHFQVNLEIKPFINMDYKKLAVIMKACLHTVHEFKDRVLLSSFDFKILQTLHEHYPDWRLGYLTTSLREHNMDQIASLPFYSVHCSHMHMIDPISLYYLYTLRYQSDKKLFFYTIKRPFGYWWCRFLGGDGVFSDIFIKTAQS